MVPELSILVVDDEFDIAELVSELLSARGHNVAMATNGRVALELLRERSYDLLITDWMMPIVDGATLVRTLRADPRHANVPVILISAQRDAVTLQAEGWVQAALQKPFSPQALYAAIDRVTGRTE